jgi:hypothetical protein
MYEPRRLNQRLPQRPARGHSATVPDMPEPTHPTSRKPDLTGPRVSAYKGRRRDGSEYLALYIPGLEPIYLNKVESRGEKSPVYSGRDGAVFLNRTKDGTRTYLSAKIEGMPKPIPLFEDDPSRPGDSEGPALEPFPARPGPT